jgi:hypothetical protein
MSVLMKIRKGTKAQLTAYGHLEAGELGFTTDENLVYVGDGSTAANYLVGRVYSGAADPSGNLVAGTIYVNTTTNRVWFCNGSAWVGTTPINDAGTSSADLWSASKIQSVVTNAMVGIGEFKDSVLDKDLTTPPVSPTNGDRYIIPANATGAWADKTGQIAQYVTNAWVFTVVIEGMCCYVDDEDLLYIYSGSTWVPINNYALASTEPGAVSSSTSGAVGSASTIARGDHSHDLSIANDYVTLAMTAHGAEQGSLLAYHGATAVPTELLHGTAGNVLISGGHGADMAWGDVDGGTFGA